MRFVFSLLCTKKMYVKKLKHSLNCITNMIKICMYLLFLFYIKTFIIKIVYTDASPNGPSPKGPSTNGDSLLRPLQIME